MPPGCEEQGDDAVIGIAACQHRADASTPTIAASSTASTAAGCHIVDDDDDCNQQRRSSSASSHVDGDKRNQDQEEESSGTTGTSNRNTNRATNGGRMRKSRRVLRKESKRQLDKAMIEASGQPSGRTSSIRESKRNLMANLHHDNDDNIDDDVGFMIEIPVILVGSTDNDHDNDKLQSQSTRYASPANNRDSSGGTIRRTRSRSREISSPGESGRSSISRDRDRSRVRSQHQRAASKDRSRRSLSRSGRNNKDEGDPDHIISLLGQLKVPESLDKVDDDGTESRPNRRLETQTTLSEESTRQESSNQHTKNVTDTTIPDSSRHESRKGGDALSSTLTSLPGLSPACTGTSKTAFNLDHPSVDEGIPRSKSDQTERAKWKSTIDLRSDRRSSSRERLGMRSNSRERGLRRSPIRDVRSEHIKNERWESTSVRTTISTKNRTSSTERGPRSKSIDRRSKKAISTELSAGSQHGIKLLYGGEDQISRLAERRPSLEETVVVGNKKAENEARRLLTDIAHQLDLLARKAGDTIKHVPHDNCAEGKRPNIKTTFSRDQIRQSRRSNRQQGREVLRSSEHSIVSERSSISKSSNRSGRSDVSKSPNSHRSRYDTSTNQRGQSRSTRRTNLVTPYCMSPMKESSKRDVVDAMADGKQTQRVSVVFRDEDGNIGHEKEGKYQEELAGKAIINPADTLLRHLHSNQDVVVSEHQYDPNSFLEVINNDEGSDSERCTIGIDSEMFGDDVQQDVLNHLEKTIAYCPIGGLGRLTTQKTDIIWNKKQLEEEREKRIQARLDKRVVGGTSYDDTLLPSTTAPLNLETLLGMIGSTAVDVTNRNDVPVSDLVDMKPKSSVDFFQNISKDQKPPSSSYSNQNRTTKGVRGLSQSKSFGQETNNLLTRRSEHDTHQKKHRRCDTTSLRHILSQSEHGSIRPSGSIRSDNVKPTKGIALSSSSSITSKPISRRNSVSNEENDVANCLPHQNQQAIADNCCHTGLETAVSPIETKTQQCIFSW
jgi:hypothetical protein